MIKVTSMYDMFNGYTNKKLRDKYDKSFKRMEKYVHQKLMDMLEEMNVDTDDVEYRVIVTPETRVEQILKKAND